MSNRGLPPRPDLDQYKKQAKELASQFAVGTPEVRERIGNYHPRFQKQVREAIPSASLQLSDAQLILAREHGFLTWGEFARYIRTLQEDRSKPAVPSDVQVPIVERISAAGVELEAHITGVDGARGIVLLIAASGSRRYHPSYRYLANALNQASICAVSADLFTEEEELADLDTGQLESDIRLLAKRASALTEWVQRDPRFQDLLLGCFASGSSAAAAMLVAGEQTGRIRSIVLGAGRPDLAGPWLWRVHAPTLFVVGGRDAVTLGFTQSRLAPFPHGVDRKLAVLDGVYNIFEEPGALENTAHLAINWFRQYMAI